MIRQSIKCEYCGGHDFEVEETILPSGISILCNRCGAVTPLIVFTSPSTSPSQKRLLINNDRAKGLYDKSYCIDITPEMLIDARKNKK